MKDNYGIQRQMADHLAQAGLVVEQLKADGYVYTDFYDFGLTEDDMLGMDGWWGTNGEIYLSLSYYEGTVTVDHTYELPNLEDYFG